MDKTQAPWKGGENPGKHSTDLELLRYVGTYGAVSVAHVMAALGLGRAATYNRTAALIEAKLLERLSLLRGEPSVLRATRKGLRRAGLPFKLAAVSPGSVEHWLRCASIGLALTEEFSLAAVLSERELTYIEQLEGRPAFSARLGEHPNGTAKLHRPDLAVLTAAEPIVIEVELTPKAPRRMEALIKAWRRAYWVSEVRYYCPPGITRRAVERAVKVAHAEERVRVLPLGEG